MTQVLPGLEVAGYQPHALHSPARDWPQTNCYTDVWIEVLHSSGLPPEAGLGFTVTQDFEGDQFTFFKFPLEDLESLYQIRVQELSVFDGLESHVACQIARGNLCLVEVDGYYLPDTAGVSWHSEHPKTTIAINRLDRAGRAMDYFHNDGFFTVSGADFDGIFGHLPHQQNQPERLFPYVEFARFDRKARLDLKVGAQARLARHLARAPAGNPVLDWQAVIGTQLRELAEKPPAAFHTYAFNTARQIGANFELLAAHLDWLGGHETASNAAKALSSHAKSLQFQLARAVTRRRFDGIETQVAALADHYAAMRSALRQSVK